MVREQNIQTAIMLYIESIGGIAIKQNEMGIYAKAGVSDIIALIRGKFVAIEVKRPGNKPSPLQLNFIKAVNELGGVAFWSDNLPDVKAKIKELL